MTGLPPTVVIAGAASGVGKSALSLGLMAELRSRGFVVQAFKVGPDFLDPLYHQRATERPSINLDRWLSNPSKLLGAVERFSRGADFCVIEGTRGLYDDLKCEDGGSDVMNPFSTGMVAQTLGADVILVVDGSTPEHSTGALIRGYQTWNDYVKIIGIVFNKVNGQSDMERLSQIVSTATGDAPISVLGGLPYEDTLEDPVPESVHEASTIESKILNLSALVSNNVDIDTILRTVSHPGVSGPPCEESLPRKPGVKGNKKGRKPRQHTTNAGEGSKDGGMRPEFLNQACEEGEHRSASSSGVWEKDSGTVRIAVAKDSAFCYYYEENLDMIKSFGAEIEFFSPLRDGIPANVSGVYLGGGVPELHAITIADNKSFRAGLKAFAEAGGIIFAEGGGLLVLGQSLQTRTGFPPQPMVGLFPFRAIMTGAKPATGYVEVTVQPGCPLFPEGSKIRGYMNHMSELVQEQHIGGIPSTAEWKCAYKGRVKSSASSNGYFEIQDGYCTLNVLASYIHHHFSLSCECVRQFIEKCRGVDMISISQALAHARRTADLLEGSVAFTPPLTPVSSRFGNGIMAVQSSPELVANRRSRPQSIDFSVQQQDYTSYPLENQTKLQKVASHGSLGMRNGPYLDPSMVGEHSRSGNRSPTQLYNYYDISNHRRSNVRHQSILGQDVDHRSMRMSIERWPLKSHGDGLGNARSQTKNPTFEATELLESKYNAASRDSLGQFAMKQVPHQDERNLKHGVASIGVCDPGIHEILLALNTGYKIIDVSKDGMQGSIDSNIGLQNPHLKILKASHHSRRYSNESIETSSGDADKANGERQAYAEAPEKNTLVYGWRKTLKRAHEINYDQLATLQPELLLVATHHHPGQGSTSHSQLREIQEELLKLHLSASCKVIILDSVGLAEYFEDILRIGEITSTQDGAIAIVKKLRERLRKVVLYSEKAKMTMNISKRPKILVFSSLHPLVVEFGWARDMIELVGGETMVHIHGSKSKTVRWEDVVAYGPKIMIITAQIVSSGDKSAKVFNDICDIASQPGWWQLPAVRDGVVVVCDESLFNHMGLKLIDGAEALARIVYGDNVPTCCPPRAAFKLRLRPGQRCRPRLLPNYFMAYC